jgi:hypothetical protein
MKTAGDAPERAPHGLHPVLVGMIAAVDVILIAMFITSLFVFDCGRTLAWQLTPLMAGLFFVMTLGIFIILPAVAAGVLAANVARIRSAVFWFGLTALLCAILGIDNALLSSEPPAHPIPEHCRIEL